jgi:hypothetical protein
MNDMVRKINADSHFAAKTRFPTVSTFLWHYGQGLQENMSLYDELG